MPEKQPTDPAVEAALNRLNDRYELTEDMSLWHIQRAVTQGYWNGFKAALDEVREEDEELAKRIWDEVK